MKSENTANELGYLIVSEIKGLGFCGGLLLVTNSGRPIEFHCAAPIKANRAQQILYGATLKEFLVCDQIGVSLLNKLKRSPCAVLIQDRELNGLEAHVDFPVVLINQQTDESEFSNESELKNRMLEIANHQFEVFGDQTEQVEQLLKTFTENLPINEPFERIREAINEAHSEAA